ncbi:MAG: FIST C-terminal domain-containing protein [Planctomycetes bacterium]|nr:FIST C-terminal domain-containing protein [Planctomycetota bacterium]
MQFRTALSTARDPDAACDEAIASLRAAFGEASPDLVLAFATPKLGDLDRIPARLAAAFPSSAIAGCSGGGVIGAGHEIEETAGLTVLAGRLPRCKVEVRVLQQQDLPDPDAPPGAWHALFATPHDRIRGLLVLPDPWRFPVAALLTGLDYAFPNAPKIGGLVSGGEQAGTQRVFAGETSLDQGAVVVAFSGEVIVEAVVAQGCRPIGRAGTVTAGSGQDLVTVDGQPALAFLKAQIDSLDERELEIIRSSPMFIGLAMDPFAADAPDEGEYLMRNIVGLDRKRGSLAIAGRPSVGRKIRFHLRDRDASETDLRRSFARVPASPKPAAALLFACLGRGVGLYGDADHDTRAFLSHFGDVPIAGFFCNGEIGPIGANTHLHGYTSAFALIRRPSQG